MSVQQNPVTYAQSIQSKLVEVFGVIPVYANFTRNWATEPKFVTWQLRNIHQDVYTGVDQNNKGIDRPIFQVSIFAQGYNDALQMSNTLLQELHGYNGYFDTLYVAKCDISWLYNTYDNELGLNQIILDCQLDIPT